MQDFLRKSRQQSFANSGQLTLGECIEKLESMKLYNDKGEDIDIDFDFGTAIPTSLDSWRGSYSELALGYALSGYDNGAQHFNNKTAKSLLDEMKEAIGKVYEGWKGGDFTMSESTPVWVANPGNSGNTGIIDIVHDGWRVVIMTRYCEY